MKQHDYDVQLEINVTVCNAENAEEAKKSALDILQDGFPMHRQDFECVSIIDLGESEEQYT